MKLNNSSKDKLRKEIEAMLKDIPEGERIKLDKGILEDLLFAKDYVYGPEENSKKDMLTKYIVWSGDFLSKIDLSEVSFDDVEWNINYFNYYGGEIGASKNYYEGIEEIVLKNTNANIDFLNSFQYKYENEPYCDIYGVNFENTDLSHSNLNNCCGYIYDTNLANTNIKFVPRDQKPFVCMNSVNLANLDLSDFYVDGVNFFDPDGEHYHYFNNCDLSNTKINITFNKNDEYYNSEARDNIISMLNTGKLKGCYLNGILIKEYNAKTIEEKEVIKNQILNEYTLFEKGIHDSVINSIQEQSKKFR